jgi:hypothetical protein
MRIRTYSELSVLNTFDERFEYLKLDGGVGRATFGYDRYLNQSFYTSSQWLHVREFVIVRDNGCDLGIPGYEIHAEPLVHHMNPMTPEDIIHDEEWILNPEFLILTRQRTHNDIHFGRKKLEPKVVAERSPGDTRLWTRR